MFIYCDLKRGIRSNWVKYVAILLFSVIVSIMMCQLTELKISYGQLSVKPSFLDILIYQFSGVKEFNPSKDTLFVLPPIWLAIQMFLAFMVSNYMTKDMEDNQKILIKSGSRIKWWGSKCIWNIISVLTSYLDLYLGILLVCIVKGSGRVAVDPEVCNMISGISLESVTAKQIIISVMIVPTVVSIGVSMIQMLFSLCLNPLFAMIPTVVIDITSVYYLHPFLLGNYSMLKRSSLIVDNGVHAVTGIILGGGMCLFGVIAGILLFQKKDIR